MKIFKRKKTILAAAVSFVVVIMALLCKPGNSGGGYDDYFGAMNSLLKESRISQPVIVLDLDRMDANIDLLLKTVKHPLKYRIVIKSLPSPDMLRYIMNRTGTARLMPFHLSHMRAILELGIPGLDMLPGIPFPVAAVESFYDSLPAARRVEMIRAVQWLIDSEARLMEYLEFAASRGIRLRVNIEIDVGLRRGGAGNPAGLSSLLSIIAANPERLVFSGFMGYDGHVTHVPIYIGSKEAAVRREFAKVMGRYREFIESGRREFPALFAGELTFNGGGSTTYALYDGSSPANDIAAGSCLVMPATFKVFTLEGHRAALFMAAPVLKKILRLQRALHRVPLWFHGVVGPQLPGHLLHHGRRLVQCDSCPRRDIGKRAHGEPSQ